MNLATSTAARRTRNTGTRRRLIEATRQLMVEQGILDMSVAEITQRAGANIALVSYHFGGREGLMLAVARDDAEAALGDLKRLLAADHSPSEKILLHVKGIIRAYYQRPYLQRLLHQLIREGSHEVSTDIAAFFMKPVSMARAQIIESGIAAGEFRKVDPALIGIAIEGACGQIFTSPEAREAILGEGHLDLDMLEKYANSTAELILQGIRKHR